MGKTHQTPFLETPDPKKVRSFLLGENSTWNFLSFLLLAIVAFGAPEGDFSLASIAFGAFGFIVPKYYDRSGKMDKRSLDSLIEGG